MCVCVSEYVFKKDLGETQLPDWLSSQGQDCMLTVVSTKRTADVAQLLTEHKGQDFLSQLCASVRGGNVLKLKIFLHKFGFCNRRRDARRGN